MSFELSNNYTYLLSLQVYIHMLQSQCTLEKTLWGGTNGNVINPAN